MCNDGHLGSFQFWVITNKAAMNILVHIFGEHIKSFLLSIYLEVELLRHIVCICLLIVDAARELSKIVVPIYILTGSARVSLFNVFN